jgi:hypothetical protein
MSDCKIFLFIIRGKIFSNFFVAFHQTNLTLVEAGRSNIYSAELIIERKVHDIDLAKVGNHGLKVPIDKSIRFDYKQEAVSLRRLFVQ